MTTPAPDASAPAGPATSPVVDPAGYDPATDHLTVERPSDGVVLVTLTNPERRNAMSGPMSASWRRLTAALAADRTVRCVVVTGAGRAFCSGGDIGWIGAEPHASVEELRARMLPFYEGWLSLRRVEVPTIAAVNGPAVGAGACVALACDLRYAGESASFSVPFTSLGMHPGMATTYLLPQVVGPAVARDLLLTGRRVGAEEMVRLGLASAAYGDAELLDRVLETARGIAATAPVATRLTTVALRDGGHASFGQALQWEALAQSVTLATEDLQEGLAAARERRPPRFTGR